MIYYALAKERSKFSSLVESAPRKCVSLRCTQKPTIVLRYYQTSWKIWINWQYQKAMNYIVYSKKISQYSYLIDIFSGNLTQAWLKKTTRLIKTKRILKRETYSAWCFQAVTHQSTNRARCCLTEVIGRELVFSTWYGRRHWYELGSCHMLNLKSRLKWFTPVRFRTLHALYTPVFITHFFQLLDTNDASV